MEHDPDVRRTQSHHETVQQYEGVLGTELAMRLKTLNDCWASLWITWKNFSELFLVDRERHKYLKEAAGGFFDNFHRLASQELILGISRLTDSPKHGGHTILSFMKKLKESGTLSSAQMAELDQIVTELVNSAAFARKWRNKVFAHKDFDLSEVGGFKWTEVETTLDQVHKFLDCVERFTLGSALLKDVIHPADQAVSLLYVLREGIESQSARQSRLEMGTFTAQDMANLSRGL